MKGLVIAGTSSGSGKTVATLVVLRALENIGKDSQPAKIGPDFIDPSHHRALTKNPEPLIDLLPGWNVVNLLKRLGYQFGGGFR